MFSSSGAPSALEKYLNDLRSDVQEKQRKIKKEEEIIKSLREELRNKKEGIRKFQEKTRELDDAVKQMHEVYVNQKQTIERIKENDMLLDQQSAAKSEELNKLVDEKAERRRELKHKLDAHKEKFEKYKEIYKTFSGVSDLMQLQDEKQKMDRAKIDILSKLDELDKDIELLEKQRELQRSENAPKFKSLNEWGTALAKKYLESRVRKTTIKSLQRKIQDTKTDIEKIKAKKQQEEAERKLQYEKEKERRAAEELGKTVSCPAIPTSKALQNERGDQLMIQPSLKSKLGNFFKSSTSFKNFQKMQSNLTSPLRSFIGSVPNLNVPFKVKESQPTAEIGVPTKSSPLSRSQSMSSLAKGSSGAVTKLAPLKASSSLQKWLSSSGSKHIHFKSPSNDQRNVERLKDANKSAVPMPMSIFQSPKEAREISTSSADAEDDVSLSTPNQNFHPYGDKKDDEMDDDHFSTPIQSPNRFNFADACKSPEDDFQFSAHVFSSKTTKVGVDANSSDSIMSSFLQADGGSPFGMFNFGIVSPPNQTSGSSDKTSDKTDFEFAIPCAPPPGSKNRHVPKNEAKTAGGEGSAQKMIWSDSNQFGPEEESEEQSGFFDKSPRNKDTPICSSKTQSFMSPISGLPFSFGGDEENKFQSSGSGFTLFGAEGDTSMDTTHENFFEFGTFGSSKSDAETSGTGFKSMFKFSDS